MIECLSFGAARGTRTSNKSRALFISRTNPVAFLYDVSGYNYKKKCSARFEGRHSGVSNDVTANYRRKKRQKYRGNNFFLWIPLVFRANKSEDDILSLIFGRNRKFIIFLFRFFRKWMHLDTGNIFIIF